MGEETGNKEMHLRVKSVIMLFCGEHRFKQKYLVMIHFLNENRLIFLSADQNKNTSLFSYIRNILFTNDFILGSTF